MTPMSYGGIHMGVEVLIWEWRCPYGSGGAHMGVEVPIWEWRCSYGSGGAEMGVEVLNGSGSYNFLYKIRAILKPKSQMYKIGMGFGSTPIITHLSILYYHPPQHSLLSPNWSPKWVSPIIAHWWLMSKWCYPSDFYSWGGSKWVNIPQYPSKMSNIPPIFTHLE